MLNLLRILPNLFKKSHTSFLKIGDFVVAMKDATYRYHPDEYYVLKDKKYKVVGIDEPDEDDETKLCFVILDESNEEHLFRYEQLDKDNIDYLFEKI